MSHRNFVKRAFDPSKAEDLYEFKYYVTNNRWRNACPFNLEWPYLDIPTMCYALTAKQYLKQVTKTK